VRTSSDDDADAKAKNQELVSAVFEALMVDDLADQLTSAVEDLTVFPNSMVFGAPESGKDEKGAWMDSMGVKMYCCAAAIG